MSTTEQRKNQQNVQFGACAKRMVKKLCTSNLNEATDEFNCAPSRPEKRWMSLSYAEVVTTTVPRSEYSGAETENRDLTLEEPSMPTGFTNAHKFIELEQN
jgi:hypothetical protein